MKNKPFPRWKEWIVSPEKAVDKIRPGMIIFLGSGLAEPRTMVRNLINSSKGNIEDIELLQLLSLGDAVSVRTPGRRRFRLKTFFSGWEAEAAIREGRVDFIPYRFVGIPKLIESGKVSIDAAIVQITPPDTYGYCSLGVAVDIAREAMDQASLVVGEINTWMPRTYGDTFVPISEFDLLVRSEDPPAYFARWSATEDLERLAGIVANLVDNGSCIAFFTGPLYEALGRHLAGKRDLGVHSPFFTDALMDLIKSGAVTNRRKGTYRGKSLTSYALGTQELLAWLDCNPLVEFQRIDKVFNPQVIGRNDGFVSVLPGHKVDLYGRVCFWQETEAFGTGLSQVMEYHSGAEYSKNGKAIFALTSRDGSGRPNFLPSIESHPNLFSHYESVGIVVSEYGVAYLDGLTVRERAQAIIEIAHPDDRKNLVEQAKIRNILYPDQIFLEDSSRLYPSEIHIVHTFKEGLTVRFRAIKPSDEEGMRHLFYRFSDQSIYYRYFHSVRAMPHTKMQEYVNVDWNTTMSLVGLIGETGKGRIIAEGRYLRLPGTPHAEVVFVVDEEYQGMGIATFIYGLLVRLAKERNIEAFLADVLFSNAAMMKVFRKGNLSVKAGLENGVYSLFIPLNHIPSQENRRET